MLKNIGIVPSNNMKKLGKLASLLVIIISISLSSYAQSNRTLADSAGVKSIELIKIKSDSIPVLFGQKSQNNLNIGSLGYLNGRTFESTPNTFIFHGLTGRIAGLRTTQSSGIPGNDNVALNLRGRTPLVLVDGIPRDISELNPEQVESVTVLKDAISSVMLGQRSINGAVLITTRKGNENANDYLNFNIKTQTGIQQPVTKRKYLDAFSYATLYNEALANDGMQPRYDQTALQAYQDGSNPFLYPNVDWQNEIYKKNAGFSRTNIFADGKSKTLRYMLSLDYLNQGGLLKELDSTQSNKNANYKRYIVRSNINLNLTKTLVGYLNLYGRINDSNTPAGGNLTQITSELNATPNNAYPVFNPDGSFGGNINYRTNLLARSAFNGFFQNLAREGFFDFGLKQSLNNLTEGLAIEGKLSFSALSNLTTNRSRQVVITNYSIDANGQPFYRRLNDRVDQSNTSDVTVSEQTSYVEFLTTYNRRFNKNGFQGIFTVNSDNYKNFTSGNLPRAITNYAASIKYDWDKKYIIEGAAAYSGLNYYREGQQYGFFPAVGLGWNIHNEAFMKPVKFIDEFKLRGSYGLTGGTNQGNFNFQRRYIGDGDYNFGPGPTNSDGLIEGPIPYDNTWSEALKTNIGFDASVFSEKLWISFDYFKNNQRKLPITTGYDSGILGLEYPTLYQGKSDIEGLETSIAYTAKQKGKFGYSVALNFSTSQTKTTFNAEQVGDFTGLARTGFFTNQNFGYIADGFVTTAGEGPVVTGYASKPGDLKYKDINGDNTIDFNDATAIGDAKPIINYGLSSQFKYGNVYLSFLIQGVSNTNEILNGNTIFPFLNTANGGKTQAFPESLNRWTPQTANTATFPRLTIGGNPNNYVASSFWLRSTSFLRLKNAEFGYNLSSKFLNKLMVKNVRLFVNGQNLFTSSDFDVFDPEMPFADYAIQKVFNGGLSVTF